MAFEIETDGYIPRAGEGECVRLHQLTRSGKSMGNNHGGA